MKVELCRGFKINLGWSEHVVGQYETDVVAFLENGEYSISYIYSLTLKTTQLVAEFDLTDKKGNSFPAKMHIALSPISGSGDNMKEFLDKVDADVSRLSSNDAVASTVSTLGIVLQLTKTIMDKLSEVRNKCFRCIVSRLTWVIRRTQYSKHLGPLFPVFTR